MKKCSPLFIAIALLILVMIVFLGREMYTQEELREKLKKYESDYGPENFELLLKYADDLKNRRELDFSDAGYAKLLQIKQVLPDEKTEDINNIIKLYTLQN
jgi:hypothetical protein